MKLRLTTVNIDTETLNLLSILLVVVNIVAFGFFGIRSEVLSLMQKNDFINEVQETITRLQEKLNQLQNAKVDLKDTKKYDLYLDKVLPPDLALQNYLVDIVRIAAQSGFEVTAFKPENTVDKTTLISVQLKGNYFGVVALVKDLEGLKRLTTVDKVEVRIDEFDQRVNIWIKLISL